MIVSIPKMRKQYLAAILALALLTAPPLQAMTEDQEDMKALEEMFPEDQPGESDFWRQDRLLITATGSQKPLRLAPSVATVVTKEEIEAIGATSLDEILETVPGLHVVPSGSHWFNSTWSIRGMHTSVNPQVLLLINGVGSTTLMEQYVVLNSCKKVLDSKKINMVRSKAGAFLTVQEMGGFQMFMARMDPELVKLWDAPCKCPCMAT